MYQHTLYWLSSASAERLSVVIGVEVLITSMLMLTSLMVCSIIVPAVPQILILLFMPPLIALH
jgi:hypothetical protein